MGDVTPHARFKVQSFNAEELWRDQLGEGGVPSEDTQHPPLRIPANAVSSNHHIVPLAENSGLAPVRVYETSGKKLLLPPSRVAANAQRQIQIISQEKAVSQGYLEEDAEGKLQTKDFSALLPMQKTRAVRDVIELQLWRFGDLGNRESPHRSADSPLERCRARVVSLATYGVAWKVEAFFFGTWSDGATFDSSICADGRQAVGAEVRAELDAMKIRDRSLADLARAEEEEREVPALYFRSDGERSEEDAPVSGGMGIYCQAEHWGGSDGAEH